jgi:hypothetical protein
MRIRRHVPHVDANISVQTFPLYWKRSGEPIETALGQWNWPRPLDIGGHYRWLWTWDLRLRDSFQRPLPPFTSPILWTLLAYLTRWHVRWFFPVAEVLHLIGAGLYTWYTWDEDLGDTYRNQHELVLYFGPYIVAFAIVYLAGQVWLWRVYLADRKPSI